MIDWLTRLIHGWEFSWWQVLWGAVLFVVTFAVSSAAVSFVLVVLGVLMAVPGVPGPGVLSILLGIMLLNFPGKRGLETRIVSRPRVYNAINSLRARFDKPPLMLDEVK